MLLLDILLISEFSATLAKKHTRYLKRQYKERKGLSFWVMVYCWRHKSNNFQLFPRSNNRIQCYLDMIRSARYKIILTSWLFAGQGLYPIPESKFHNYSLTVPWLIGNSYSTTWFFHKEPVYKEPTCRQPEYLRNLYH